MRRVEKGGAKRRRKKIGLASIASVHAIGQGSKGEDHGHMDGAAR